MGKVTNPNMSEVFVIEKVKKILLLKKLIEELNGEKMMERFMKKICKRQIKPNLELKKITRKKVTSYVLSGKIMEIDVIPR